MKKEIVPWLKSVLLIGGLIWVTRSVQELFEPNYWHPITPFDYVAVAGTSLQMFFLSAAMWGLYKIYPLPPSTKQKVWFIGIIISVLASTAVGVSNFIEDAIGVKEIEFMFTIGGFGMLLGLLISEIGALINTSIRSKFSWFIVACFVGFGFPDYYGGIVLGIALWVMAFQEYGENNKKYL